MVNEKKIAVLFESIFLGMLIVWILVQAISLLARHESRVFALENTILFECHEAYAFGNSDVKEAIARIVRACADYIDEGDIDDPALVIFMDEVVKRKRGKING